MNEPDRKELIEALINATRSTCKACLEYGDCYNCDIRNDKELIEKHTGKTWEETSAS